MLERVIDCRWSRGGGLSSPPYPQRHAGPCIVAGAAECLHDDLARAWAVYPGIPVIAVNNASRETKAIALYSKHPKLLIERRWIHHQKRLFGPDFTVHGSRYDPDCPHVQYFWEDARGGGGSAWGARKLAWLMGFDPVILCGCPLIPGPYTNGSGLGGLMNRDDVVSDMLQQIADESEWHEGAYSMSGATMDILGDVF